MKKTIIIFLLTLHLTSLAQVINTDVDIFIENNSYDLVEDRISCMQPEMPLHFNNKVYGFIDYFAVRNRAYTKEVIRKSTIYFPIFEEYLKKYNLPLELKYLAIVESGLRPQVISRASAGGLWQFMPYTGKMYDLHQDWYIDERFDPYKSTEAACKYLSNLYAMFGDWELALAAYNSGPGNVRKAIRKSGYKKGFWEIYRYLPRETRSYVPQFVAVAYTMHYAEEYNLLSDEPAYLMESDTLMLKGYANLKTLAQELSICYDDIQSLNPNLKHFGIKSANEYYPIRLPIDKIEEVRNNRDTLLYLARLNGQKDLEYMARNSAGSTYGRDKHIYKVKSGDVLGTIAGRYSVRVSDLKKWNRLSGTTIRVGQNLTIWTYPNTKIKPVAKPSVITAKHRVPVDLNGKKTHTVQPGDTLWDISRMYKNLDIEKIKELNKLESDKLKPGQILIIG
jgi:peptidoglycan lytic transglycosylase D